MINLTALLLSKKKLSAAMHNIAIATAMGAASMPVHF